MATFDLNIHCSNIDEFADIARRLCGAAPAAITAGEPDAIPSASESTLVEAVEKPKRSRGKKADEPAPADIFPTGGEAATGTEAASSASGEQTATPAAGSAEQVAAVAEGEVSMQQLKDAMADLLKSKSAGFAMKTLEDATGCKSLSSGSPSVAEKAKTDPAIMQVALDALVAGKTAA